MIASLRAKIESIQSHHIEMQTVLTALKQSIERGSIEDMHRQLEELHMQMEELRASIRQFRTHPKAKDEDANLTVQEPDAANL
jgi:chromosome segregation ATPase